MIVKAVKHCAYIWSKFCADIISALCFCINFICIYFLCYQQPSFGYCIISRLDYDYCDNFIVHIYDV